MSDPGSLTIPCQFGNLEVCQAFADSGASINIMPILEPVSNDTCFMG